MSSSLTSDASNSRMNSTDIRVPSMMGFPPSILGLTVIRSISGLLPSIRWWRQCLPARMIPPARASRNAAAKQIPRCARIVNVLEFVDRMVSLRRWRPHSFPPLWKWRIFEEGMRVGEPPHICGRAILWRDFPVASRGGIRHVHGLDPGCRCYNGEKPLGHRTQSRKPLVND